MRNPLKIDLDEMSSFDHDKAVLWVAEGSPRLELDGVSISWEESGEGVPVVCLHAAGHGARDFRLLQKESPAGCRLLLLDWPGHGRSTADSRSFTVERCVGVLTAFLNALGLRNAILLGSEFGAAVALAYAIQYPARVRGLVLCQPAGLLAAVSSRRPMRLGRNLRRGARALIRRPADTPAELEQLQVDLLEPKHALLHNQAALSVLALEETLRSGLAQGLCPVLVALAARSRIYPLKPLLRFLNPLLSVTPLDQPGKPKLAIFSGQYSPLWENPERLALVLSGFARGTLPLDSHPHSWTLAAVDWPSRGMNQWLCTHPGCHAAQTLPIEENPNHTRR